MNRLFLTIFLGAMFLSLSGITQQKLLTFSDKREDRIKILNVTE